ncbi:phosphatidylinositol 3-kinase VPS34 [Ascoidea rubescens DSM 1968]|uniref:Phosphatidylinositol 3-kinase VPS34 n=1 Tax=Ascoidea rubescens DSM 1968 TaxID=1344418 RepID=A0A1D2VL63_9ASCO|nr:kinase-like protein [Ascoidea rubescens DSM 1968]ODV62360.1 kinase-like protein [Ascoidea rubescens DSM 1968]
MMFKIGDDLRQDQLVIQIIKLMDQLLKNENLNLNLKPYKILSTNPIDGSIEFVPNLTLDKVLSEYHSILKFFQENNYDEHEELKVKSHVMDRYIKSCAGYCVITYILGVGDRHLDNLLISLNGQFFHADFGYILGQDPKPFPPLMKLPIQLVEGMGGLNHENFKIFKNYCFTSFLILRKNSNLILNLFELMIEANIPDIKIDKNRAILKVKEKFCLEMNDEEAILHFQNLINDSVNAFLPMVIDRLHSLTQYWRA